MNEISQGFTKGITRTTRRSESFDPDVFYTLQNARVLQNGNIGEVVRIKGYEELVSSYSDIDNLLDIIIFDGNFVVFYKTTTIDNDDVQFKIIIYNSTGGDVVSFSYYDADTDEGKLKEYDDTIFVAPHNKIIYKQESSYYLKDFISSPPKILATDTETISPSPIKAKTVVEFTNTLPNFSGVAAKGYIRVMRNNIPSGVTDTIRVSIDNVESSDIVVYPTTPREEIAELITTEINNSFSNNWEATQLSNEVLIQHKNVGANNNDVSIKIVHNKYIKVDNEHHETRNREALMKVNTNTVDDLSAKVELLSLMIFTTDTYGGQDPVSFFGSVQAILSNGLKSNPVTISDSDSVSSLATKVGNALNDNKEITDIYDVTISGETITIESKQWGNRYYTDFTIIAKSARHSEANFPDDFYTVTTNTAGVARVGGTLEPNTPYWYKARYKYIDGHVTSTCSAALQFSDNDNRYIDILFEITEKDLDGINLPNLQIFRKKGGGEFSLIKEINLDEETITENKYTFSDEGFSEIDILEDTINIWTKSHKTEEVLDNRYIKANLTFFDSTYEVDSSYIEASTKVDDSNEDVIPYNSKAVLYTRPQYSDGTLGYFEEIGELSVSNKNRKIEIDQKKVVEAGDKVVDELRFYAKYLPYTEEENLRFGTPEIMTPNLQGIEDPDLFPTQTKILFGYKYITVIDTGSEKSAYITVSGWDGEQKLQQSFFRFVGKVRQSTATLRSGIRETENGKILANIHSTEHSYIPVAFYNSNTGVKFIVYKLEKYEALKEAVSTGELYTRLNRSNISSLSSVLNDDEIIGSRVKVLGIEDKSETSDVYDLVKDEFSFSLITAEIISLLPAKDSRIYLILEDSNLNEIDNNDINNYDLKFRNLNARGTGRKTDLDISANGRLFFDIINFKLDVAAKQEGGDGSFDLTNSNKIQTDNGIYEEVNLQEATYFLINRNVNIGNALIYLGKKENKVSKVTLPTTGFRYKLRRLLTYSVLAPYNIYETLILKSDFNFNRTNAPNQIIWSSPLLQNNYYAGGRNFNITNFFNVPTENGEIIDIVSLQGRLYVFCETGVAQIFIGEVLTQQKEGHVFVDSSTFMTKSMWVLEKTPNIRPKSIVKYENYIYFTDGNDVYRINNNGVENITQGILVLDNEADYVSTVVKKYDEYRLSDPNTNETYVFNAKYGKWYGPFTYTPLKTIELDNKIISYINKLVVEDTGNTFDEVAFTTKIQSVGNDTQIGQIDKTYRKFYLNVYGDEIDVNSGSDVQKRITDTTFKYGKDYTSMVSKELDEVDSGVSVVAVKNGWYQFGIEPNEGNTKKIFWDIETTNPNFSLLGFVTGYMLRRRR